MSTADRYGFSGRDGWHISCTCSICLDLYLMIRWHFLSLDDAQNIVEGFS